MILPGEYIHYCFLFVREKALSSAFFNPYSFNGLFQVPAEKFSQFVERDDVDPVVQIDVNEIGERIGSVCHGIRQIGPEPDRVSDPVVGLVQMKVELLGMFGGLRVEKGLYPGILHSVPVFAGCLGTGVRAGKINCRT